MLSLLQLGEQNEQGCGVRWRGVVKSQLLVHTHVCVGGGGIGHFQQRQGRAVWLVGAGWCREPMLLSSGVVLDVILNFIPKILLELETGKVKERVWELDGKDRY